MKNGWHFVDTHFHDGVTKISRIVLPERGCQYIVYEILPQINTYIIQDAKPKIFDARLTIIFRMGQWPCRLLFYLYSQQMYRLC